MAKTADSQNTTNTLDPILAAISAHLAAIADLDRDAALYEAGAIDGSTVDAGNVFLAAQVVVDTAPTTAAGLAALSDHLREHFAYGRGFALLISRPLPGGSEHGGGEGAAEGLIAKRAAELGMAG
jgi:hypothetical protein